MRRVQVEQLTLALGHTARQKANAESRIRLYEQVRVRPAMPLSIRNSDSAVDGLNSTLLHMC